VPLLQVLIVLIVVGVLLWLVNTYIPMQGAIKSLLNGVVVIVVNNLQRFHTSPSMTLNSPFELFSFSTLQY
jgi:membrane-bound ClpP family serine protease